MDWSQCSAGGANGVPTLSCLPQLFTVIVFYAFLLAGILAVIIIIWAGAKYIRSGGDAKQTQGARQTLTFAIIGLILVLSSMFILNIIATVTGVKCILNFGFGTCGGTGTGDQSIHYNKDYGCFPSVTSGAAPGCAIGASDNNPKIPYEWFSSADACNAVCVSKYGSN